MSENKKFYVKRIYNNKVVRNPLTEAEYKNLPKGEYEQITPEQHAALVKPRKNK